MTENNFDNYEQELTVEGHTTLSDLLAGSGISELNKNLSEIDPAFISTNMQFIEQFSIENENGFSPFYYIKNSFGEAVIIYRTPTVLNYRKVESGKTYKKVAHYFECGFIGLSPYGLFIIKFPNIRIKPGRKKDWSFDDSLVSRDDHKGDAYLNFVNSIEGKVSERPATFDMYLSLVTLANTPGGVLPVIEVKRNLPQERDPIIETLSHQTFDSWEGISNLNTQEGISIWRTILSEVEAQVREQVNIRNELIDFHERYLPNDPKDKEG